MEVWNLYVKTKEFGITPSEYLRVEEYVNRKYGLDGWWTCVQVDDAIYSVGRYIESKTTGFDKNNKPKPSVSDYFKALKDKKSGLSIVDKSKGISRLKRGSFGNVPPKRKKVS